MNHTTPDQLPPLPPYTLYPRPSLIPGIPDSVLNTVALVVVYWVYSMIFHVIDVWDLFPQYRLHTPAEVLKRNHATRWEVVRDVLLQQFIQSCFTLGLGYFEPPEMAGKEDYDIAVWATRIRVAQAFVPRILGFVGLDSHGLANNIQKSQPVLAAVLAGGLYPHLTQTLMLAGEQSTVPAFAGWEISVAKAIYHVGFPALQFMVAIVVVDTWQYFVHRAMHMNKWLYTTFHARHHRLYVPYAYGALYNHPGEAFFLDTLSSAVAYLIAGLSPRQGICFFSFSTVKTVDDHCGYHFPWDPLQLITTNNAKYHDIHHQSWGIKSNFSQPYFTFWDTFLGTKWVGGDVSARYERSRIAAQNKVDAELNSTQISKPGVDADKSQPKDASSPVQAAQVVAEPRVPAGKASQQAAAGRQQILDDHEHAGVEVLAEETAEEVHTKQRIQRHTRHRSTSSGLKGLAEIVGDALHGKSSGVLGVERR